MTKCLIVDDVEVSRFTSEQILAALGLTTVTAATIEEGLAALEDNNIGVVLLDWHLRKISGLDMLAKIREKHGKNVRVIMFSGVEGADKQIEAIKAGADAFLEKPTTKEKVQACLKSVGVL